MVALGHSTNIFTQQRITGPYQFQHTLPGDDLDRIRGRTRRRMVNTALEMKSTRAPSIYILEYLKWLPCELDRGIRSAMDGRKILRWRGRKGFNIKDAYQLMKFKIVNSTAIKSVISFQGRLNFYEIKWARD